MIRYSAGSAEPTEFAPAMDNSGILPGLPSVRQAGACRFRGGAMTSDAGYAARRSSSGSGSPALADCIEDPRARSGCGIPWPDDPLPRAADRGGYPDGNDCDALRPIRRSRWRSGAPESGADLCSQPTISRLEPPRPIALKRMMAAMVECSATASQRSPGASFSISTTPRPVTAASNSRCSTPIRQPLLPAYPYLERARQAGGDHPAPRQTPTAPRSRWLASCDRPYPRPLAGGRIVARHSH